MKSILIAIFLLCLKFSNSAQSVFSKVYYDSTFVRGYSIIPALDGGYLIAGKKEDTACVFKIDSIGNFVWGKGYASSFPSMSSSFQSIEPTSDSCYIVIGNTSSGTTTAYRDIICMKLNVNGDTVWTKGISGITINYNLQYGNNVQQTYDKGYILVGNDINNVTLPYSHTIVIKLDSIGNLEWKQILTTSNHENIGIAIRQLPDSSYVVLAGCETNNPSFMTSTTLINLSTTGNINWTKQYNRSTYVQNWGFDMEIKPDGIVCYLNLTFGGIGLMKTDFAGNILWSKKYNGLGNNTWGNYPKINPTSDGGFVFVNGGITISNNELFKVDSTGNLLWKKNIQYSPYEVMETKDKGLILIGNGNTYTQGLIGIIKTDSIGDAVSCVYDDSTGLSTTDSFLGTSVVTSGFSVGSLYNTSPSLADLIISVDTGCIYYIVPIGINEIETKQIISIYPNPFTSQTTISFNAEQKHATIKIIDMLGKEMKTIDLTGTQVVIDKGEMNAGIYFVQIKDEMKNSCNKKIIIQ